MGEAGCSRPRTGGPWHSNRDPRTVAWVPRIAIASASLLTIITPSPHTQHRHHPYRCHQRHVSPSPRTRRRYPRRVPRLPRPRHHHLATSASLPPYRHPRPHALTTAGLSAVTLCRHHTLSTVPPSALAPRPRHRPITVSPSAHLHPSFACAHRYTHLGQREPSPSAFQMSTPRPQSAPSPAPQHNDKEDTNFQHKDQGPRRSDKVTTSLAPHPNEPSQAPDVSS